MTDEKKKDLTAEALAQEQGEAMPDREEMSRINANTAIPVNAGVALNALSDNSTATANATQNTPIVQKN